ncbi:MAG: phospholipid carrier-dependent glycosyltransferase [Candidatus Wallbacteria bacterium]|nr:phospholipid carrier-dependent glycosyltransferase [Candidatus Wallbacteria bacterium]
MGAEIRKIIKFFINHPWVVILILTLFGFFSRLYHLGQIKEQIMDEIYFVTFARDYLNGIHFFDVHPPLGKLIIALSIKIFGDTYFAARLMPAVFGTALIPLVYLLARELGGKIVGIFAAAIVTFDGMLLVYSRTGMIDIFMAFFIVSAFYFFLKYANQEKIFPFLPLAGIALGLAASIKYIGGLTLFTFVLVALLKKIPLRRHVIYLSLFVLFIPVVVYLVFFLFDFGFRNFIPDVYHWHLQSLTYNLNLQEGHPYGSKWWTWFLLLRPIWLYFKDVNGSFIGVDGIGNPIAWWSALLVVPALIWKTVRKDQTSQLILGAFLILFIPWAFIGRVVFIYHAIPAFIFVAIGTAYLLKALLTDPWGKITVGAYFSVLIAFYIFFLPIWMGFPLESSKFYLRMWLKSWI